MDKWEGDEQVGGWIPLLEKGRTGRRWDTLLIGGMGPQWDVSVGGSLKRWELG